jgi:methylated-DNA-[protein]-cysteine S-methyltransferase
MRAKTQKNKTPEWTVCLEGTPMGSLLLTFTANGLAALNFAGEGCKIPSGSPPLNLATLIESVKNELTKYFSKHLVDFNAVPLDLQGTPFQQKVWRELQRIPRGRTVSYKELARRAGSPQGFRAVGQANGRNPVPIIVPCHRVISADGSLGGYSSGLDKKRWLLQHEGAM